MPDTQQEEVLGVLVLTLFLEEGYSQVFVLWSEVERLD